MSEDTKKEEVLNNPQNLLPLLEEMEDCLVNSLPKSRIKSHQIAQSMANILVGVFRNVELQSTTNEMYEKTNKELHELVDKFTMECKSNGMEAAEKVAVKILQTADCGFRLVSAKEAINDEYINLQELVDNCVEEFKDLRNDFDLPERVLDVPDYGKVIRMNPEYNLAFFKKHI